MLFPKLKRMLRWIMFIATAHVYFSYTSNAHAQINPTLQKPLASVVLMKPCMPGRNISEHFSYIYLFIFVFIYLLFLRHS